MSLWCDKYRPSKLKDLDYNQPQAANLRRLIKSVNFPHLAIFGCSGSGKKTRVNALLHDLYDSSVQNLVIKSSIFDAPSGKKIEQRYVASNFHVEVNPNENGYYDRVVVQELIKTVATSSLISKRHPFRVVVILEADRLTREAQQALRRTLEKYAPTCRVILIGERVSKLIPALKSRCLMLRNPAPTDEMVRAVLERVAVAEGFGPGKNAQFNKALDGIVTQADRNLRRAILLLQSFACSTAAAKNGPNSQPVLLAFRWQDKMDDLAKKLGNYRSVRDIPSIRAALYDLMVHLIPAELILRLLTQKLLGKCMDEDMKAQLLRMAARVDARMAGAGAKSIIHLELFCVKYMTMFQCSLERVEFDDESIEID